jgi:hypothetical protein
MTMIPHLSPEQLEGARQAATEARRRRAELKAKVRAGDLSFNAALDLAIADPVLAHVKVVDLLMAVHRVGEKKAADIIRRHGIAANRRVRGLGARQVARLKAEFE